MQDDPPCPICAVTRLKEETPACVHQKQPVSWNGPFA